MKSVFSNQKIKQYSLTAEYAKFNKGLQDTYNFFKKKEVGEVPIYSTRVSDPNFFEMYLGFDGGHYYIVSKDRNSNTILFKKLDSFAFDLMYMEFNHYYDVTESVVPYHYETAQLLARMS